MIDVIVTVAILIATFAAGFVAGWGACRSYSLWWGRQMSEKIADELLPLQTPMERPFKGKLSDPENSPFIPATRPRYQVSPTSSRFAPEARPAPPQTGSGVMPPKSHTPTADALRQTLKRNRTAEAMRDTHIPPTQSELKRSEVTQPESKDNGPRVEPPSIEWGSSKKH